MVDGEPLGLGLVAEVAAVSVNDGVRGREGGEANAAMATQTAVSATMRRMGPWVWCESAAKEAATRQRQAGWNDQAGPLPDPRRGGGRLGYVPRHAQPVRRDLRQVFIPVKGMAAVARWHCNVLDVDLGVGRLCQYGRVDARGALFRGGAGGGRLPQRPRRVPYADVRIVSVTNSAWMLPTVFRAVWRRAGLVAALRETNRATTADPS